MLLFRSVFFSLITQVLCACEFFCAGYGAFDRRISKGVIEYWDELGNLSDIKDIVLDCRSEVGCADGRIDKFSVLFLVPGESGVKSIVLRNFCDSKRSESIYGVLRSFCDGQKLKVYGDITRELGNFEGVFNFGGAGIIPGEGVSRMEIEVYGDVNIGFERGNPLFCGTLSFGEWSEFGKRAYGGPSRVLVRGDINIFGLGKLRCGVGRVVPTGSTGCCCRGADFEVLGAVNMTALDVSYPTWILNNRNNIGDSEKFGAVVKIGALNGMGLVMNDAENAISTLVIANPAGVVGRFKGRIQDGASVGGDSRISLVKDGKGAQYFLKTFGKKRFTGGLKVKDGQIYLNSTESIGNLSLEGGIVGTLPCEDSYGNVPPVLTVSDFNWSGGEMEVRLYGQGVGSEIRVCGDFKVSGEMKFKFVLKTSALADKYRIFKWNRRPSLEGKIFSHNELAGIDTVFESRDDGLYVVFKEKEK